MSFEASCIVLRKDLTSCIAKSQRTLSQPQLNLLLSNSNHSCLLLQVRSRFRFSSNEWLSEVYKKFPSFLMALQVYSICIGRDRPTWFKARPSLWADIAIYQDISTAFSSPLMKSIIPRPNKSHCTSHQPCPSCWTITHADNQSRDQNRTEKCNLPHAVSQAASVNDLQVRLPGLRSG